MKVEEGKQRNERGQLTTLSHLVLFTYLRFLVDPNDFHDNTDDAPTPTASTPNADRLKINIPPPITSKLQAEQGQVREKEKYVRFPCILALFFPPIS